MNDIAILLATYQGARYVEQMLESLEGQTCKEFVCYIHDDGSDDGTNEIVDRWIANHPTRFRRLVGPVQGSARDNFLWMLSMVDATYYMFADQDDVWLPQKIEKSLACLTQTLGKCNGFAQSEEPPVCVFTDMYVTDAELHVTDASFIRYIGRDPHRVACPQIIIDNPAAGCTMLFNRPLREAALQLQDNSRVEMHDVWVLALAAAYGKQHVGVVDEPLVYYRQHGANEMGAKSETIGHKILRNVGDLLTGKIRGDKHAFIMQARNLAGQLCLVDSIPEEQKKMLSAFAQVGKLPKGQRVRFYKNNGFTRLHGTTWMYFWV